MTVTPSSCTTASPVWADAGARVLMGSVVVSKLITLYAILAAGVRCSAHEIRRPDNQKHKIS
jgi:hypothetical protein